MTVDILHPPIGTLHCKVCSGSEPQTRANDFRVTNLPSAMGSCAIGQFRAHAFMLKAKSAAFDFARCTAIVALNSAHQHHRREFMCLASLIYCSVFFPSFASLTSHPLLSCPSPLLPLFFFTGKLPLMHLPLLQNAAKQTSSASQTKVLCQLWDIFVKC